jgi:hypothetical protein
MRPSVRNVRRGVASVGACLLLAGPFVMGGSGPAGAADVTTPPTAFEIDGNVVVDSTGDWNSTAADYPSLRDNSSYLEVCNSNPVEIDGEIVTDETSRVPPGTKLDGTTTVTPPIIQPGNVARKTDLCRVWRAWELVLVPDDPANPDAGGQYQFVLYGGWSRPATNGEIDVLIPLLGSDPLSAEDDIVISYDFQDNTQTTDVQVLSYDAVSGEWEPTTLVDGSLEAVTTEGVVTDPALPGQELTFGEFALNLTVNGLLPENGPCTTFTTSTVYSRTGNSADATMADAVELPPLTLTNCGSLQVTKDAIGFSDGPVDFDFSVFEADGEDIQYPDVVQVDDTLTVDPAPGSASTTITDLLISPDYVVEETGLPAGWTQSSLVCSALDPLTGLVDSYILYPAGNDLFFPIAPGYTASCTITNLGPEPPPIVTITKVTNGDTPWSFDFEVIGSIEGDPVFSETVTLTDADPTTTVVLEPGLDYEVVELVSDANYVYGPVICGTGEGADNTFSVPAELEGPFEIGCSATNTQKATVEVTKSVDPSAATGWSFDVTISPVPDEQEATQTVTAAEPTVEWTGLIPGEEYTITESSADGFRLIAIDCGDGTGTFSPTAAETATCDVFNQQLANVTVRKVVDPETATGWSFPFTISPVPEGETATKDATAELPSVSWANLVPGTEYTISEGTVAGYQPLAIDCDETGTGTFMPGAGDSVSCTATNEQLANVTVRKVVEPGTATGWSFDLTISPVPTGETATKPVTSAAPSASWVGLVPGEEYTITEASAAGYQLVDIVCGEGDGTFTPASGESVSCTATNEQLASLSLTKSVTNAVAGEAGRSTSRSARSRPARRPPSRPRRRRPRCRGPGWSRARPTPSPRRRPPTPASPPAPSPAVRPADRAPPVWRSPPTPVRR